MKTFPAFVAHAQPTMLRIWQEAHTDQYSHLELPTDTLSFLQSSRPTASGTFCQPMTPPHPPPHSPSIWPSNVSHWCPTFSPVNNAERPKNILPATGEPPKNVQSLSSSTWKWFSNEWKSTSHCNEENIHKSIRKAGYKAPDSNYLDPNLLYRGKLFFPDTFSWVSFELVSFVIIHISNIHIAKICTVWAKVDSCFPNKTH